MSLVLTLITLFKLYDHVGLPKMAEHDNITVPEKMDQIKEGDRENVLEGYFERTATVSMIPMKFKDHNEVGL